MSDSTNDYTVQIVMSIFAGLIIVTSEILPFIKSVKSNGLLELIIQMSIKLLTKNNQILLLDEEQAPLFLNNEFNTLPNNQLHVRIPIENTEIIHDSNLLLNKIDTLNTGINNISYTLNSYINEAQNSRQLKLQSIELYELNYIINYIKVNYPKKMFQTKFLSKINKQLLISQGYIIDYDSQCDTYTIKW
jgi:hypothetical protein